MLNPFNFLGISKEKIYAYDDLIYEINRLTVVPLFLQEKDIFRYYVIFIATLLSNNEIYLLDYDFSSEEVERLMEGKNNKRRLINLSYENIDNVIADIKTSMSKIVVFTSGTTGRPTQVIHSIRSITREIKVGGKFKNHKWLMAYNPSHMAGLQVFFQAFFNLNVLVYVFGQRKEAIINIIRSFNVTHISATPTFYRLLFPLKDKFTNVVSVAFGGEKSNAQLYKQIGNIFPNAKLINIYASTEGGSLFTSVGSDVFSLKPKLKNLVKIVNNELYLHKSLLGELSSACNEEELWYATGDLVQITGRNPLSFKFVHRKSEMINIGGNKVNPSEVEIELNKLDIVALCVIYKETSSVLSNILCADIVLTEKSIDKSETRKMIKRALKDKLQPFKIPRKMKFVETINQTRTGKIKRIQ